MNLRSLAFAATLALAAPTAGCRPSSAAGVVRVDGREAHRLVAAGALLLDVRTPEEYAAGHLPGAVNIPVGELEHRTGEVPAGRPVVVYCLSGVRSAAAAQMLLRAGRGDVYDLGAMASWN